MGIFSINNLANAAANSVTELPGGKALSNIIIDEMKIILPR